MKKAIPALGPIIGTALAFLAAPALAADDAAMTKLLECMKLKAAAPEQKSCLQKVQSLSAGAKATAAPPKTKAAVAAAPMAKKTDKAVTVIEVPPEVKRAAAEVGLAGGPRLKGGADISATGAGATVGDLKGLDLDSAMMVVQSRRAEMLEHQLKTEIGKVQQRNEEIAKLNDQINQLRAKNPPDNAQIDKLKGQIDSLNNSQQMDMLRLQSLTNKRNEAFDLMTNFIKKMADNRASILGNMR